MAPLNKLLTDHEMHCSSKQTHGSVSKGSSRDSAPNGNSAPKGNFSRTSKGKCSVRRSVVGPKVASDGNKLYMF